MPVKCKNYEENTTEKRMNGKEPSSQMKRTDWWLKEVGDVGVGKMDDGDLKAQTSSYKVSQSWGCCNWGEIPRQNTFETEIKGKNKV